jgi:hypothetical protein
MERQFPNKDQRLALCGYGVPDLKYAISCARDRATVIVQDVLPNAVFESDAEHRVLKRRLIKYFRFPIPDDVLLAASAVSDEAELRITLSYFAEPSTSRRRERRGLDLAFDIQGPQETEVDFRQRMNRLLRPRAPTIAERMEPGDSPDEERDGPEGSQPSGGRRRSGRFGDWAIGPQRRGRSTVQSDRLVVSTSYLAGPKLVAVYPVLGWWDDRRDTEEEEMTFSLVVSLEAPGRDIYTPIRQSLELAAPQSVEITIEIQPNG